MERVETYNYQAVPDPNSEPCSGVLCPFDNQRYRPISCHPFDQRLSAGTTPTAKGTSEMYTAVQNMHGPDSKQDQ